MQEWKSIRIPKELYERIQQIANESKRSVADIVREVLSCNIEISSNTDEQRECLFCGKPCGTHLLCDDCYYDPSVIRPQIMGVLFTEYRLRLLRTTGNSLSLDDFIALMDEETAKAHYVTDEEWQEWLEWLEWREKMREDPLARYSLKWRQWVTAHPILRERHLGNLFAVERTRGKGQLTSIGEILRQVSPSAFKVGGQECQSGQQSDSATKQQTQ